MTEFLPMAAATCAPTGVGGWIGTIIFGAIIGALARLVLPGKQNISLIITIIIGIVGALIGYWLAAQLGVCATSGIDWIRWIISIIVAAVLVVIYGSITGRRTTA
ncbi:MAG TPA: GlsB/YeaQ/YmgE family stress response membrane protein [Candidatus Limnocylindrales bacterium]|nr:GlsB/YeaQ/YmgE family stress response membrane protein [Phycicoccus sp.]HEU0245344.1 GlsB/YeaQ/YmgE family stress response membrane protein [Candidatus Limnocylindrales bacterium]